MADFCHCELRDRQWNGFGKCLRCGLSYEDQRMPVVSSSPAIIDLVHIDLRERDRVGVKRYGLRLQAHNGRDALRDAYEEALDLAIYLRQAIEERTALTKKGPTP